MTLSHEICADILSGSISLIVASVVVAVVGAFGFILKPALERNRQGRKEREAVIYQCVDLIRHFQSNIEVIENIIEQWNENKNKIFSLPHLLKLNLIPQSSSFSHDLYRTIPPIIVGQIHHLKLRVRNIEIELRCLHKTYHEGSCQSIHETLTIVSDQFEASVLKTQDTIRQMGATEQFIKSKTNYHRKIQPCL